jgi:signal transduction histidine kinase
MIRPHTSLFWKLMLAFVLVVLVAVGGATLVTRQITTSEFRRLRLGEMLGAVDQALVQSLADYYASHGNWEGVASILSPGRGSGRAGRGNGPPLILVNADGRVVVDTAGDEVGVQLSSPQLASGEPILVNGKRVGTLLIGGVGAGVLSQADQTFLAQVQQALIIGGLGGVGVALMIGFVLFRGITAPLRRLTRAIAAVAQGDLSVQVPVPAQGGDEVSQLGQAFNRMTLELARSDQLRRNMTADIAHELRTPLTVIQGNLEAVLDGVYPADSEHLEPVLRKTQLLRRLVDDLRTLALADAGELVQNRAPLDLGRLTKRVVADFQTQAQAAGVTLTGVVPAQLPVVAADALRIEQVVGILLDNALKHTPAGGWIRAEVHAAPDEIRASVQDSGTGIAPEALPRLFERFYRTRTEQPAEGSGLGLAIAKAIVSAHDGRIWAESTLGTGTTVTFALPVKPR